jgi:hypothetical protein
VIRHQRRLSDCLPYLISDDHATTHLQNYFDKSLFRNTLPLTLFDGAGTLELAVSGGRRLSTAGLGRQEQKLPYLFNRLREKSPKQIPRGLRPTRNDKIKGLYGAPKGASLQNTLVSGLFSRPLKPVRGDKGKASTTAHPSAGLGTALLNLAKSERPTAKRGYLGIGLAVYAC